MKKFLYQSLACLLITGIFMYSSSHTGKICDLTSRIIYEMNREYKAVTLSEIPTMAVEAAKKIPGVFYRINETMAENTLYGEPVDEKDYDGFFTVHSVCGGTVTETGTNDDIGRYVIIRHGTESESVYGNLSEVSCSLNERVRKGDMIGIYNDKCGKEFYYSLDKLKAD